MGYNDLSLLRKGFFYVLIALFILWPAGVQGARRGKLAGRVIDLINGRPVPEAIVTIQGTDIATLTDDNGRFSFDLDEGTYSISILKDEYFKSNYQDIEVEGGKITTYRCELVPGDPSQSMFFSIGGITVLDKRDLLPDKIETTHEISSAEIEHQLSTNLGDILDMVPGVERTEPPGLSKKAQAEIRGTGYVGDAENRSAALFGTKVILDDIPISNNANLQAGTGTFYGSTTAQTAGSGIDLRTIPADNIEKVEIVTGVPSVEHGDMTESLVKVMTKMGRQPHRLKIKSNPDTKEASLSGGWSIRQNAVSYSVNAAYSERDIRREQDQYTRYNAQLTIKSKLLGENLLLLNKFKYNGVLDEIHVDPSDPIAIAQNNKDKTFIYGHTIDYKPSKDTKLEWRANLSFTNRDSYYQRLIGADTRVLSDAMEPGTNEAFVNAGAYLSRIWTKGEEWNVTAKLNFKWNLGLFRLNHALLTGGEYTFDDNVGQGKIFNPLEPPHGNLGERPLPFDASPELQTANIYVEDEISGFLLSRPFSVNLGFRYEMYTPFKLHLDGLFNEKGVVESKNGTFLNPRIRAKYTPFENTQIRFGYGWSSKMPSMTSIYQGPMYIDVVEENVTPPDSTPLVTTYVFNYDNTNLKGYQSEKTELALDQKVGPVGVSVTGFLTRSEDIPRDVRDPITLYRYRWSDYPNAPESVIDTIYTVPGNNEGYYARVGWYKNYGLEFLLTTKRIEKISTSFRVSAAYTRSESGAEGTYMSDPRPNTALDRTIYPFYYYGKSWRSKVIVSYSADWFIRKVGMWVTFFLQQTLFDQNLSQDDPVIYAIGYYDPIEGRTISITPGESTALGLDRSYDEYDLTVQKRPNDRVLLNLNVSKSVARGAEISFFVHNFFDDPAYYQDYQGYWHARNHRIFYGIEFSMILDELWRRGQ